jgi:hypothetical protein
MELVKLVSYICFRPALVFMLCFPTRNASLCRPEIQQHMSSVSVQRCYFQPSLLSANKTETRAIGRILCHLLVHYRHVKLTPWSRILVWWAYKWSKIPCLLRILKFITGSQDPATGFYPKPSESSPYPHTLFLYDPFHIILPSTPRSS